MSSYTGQLNATELVRPISAGTVTAGHFVKAAIDELADRVAAVE